MGTCDILVGSNPAMDTHPVQGRGGEGGGGGSNTPRHASC